MISRVVLLLWCIFCIHLGVDATCLNYVACYNDLSLNDDAFRIYHSNLEERSAVSCATICLQRWPDTQVVLVKLVDVNQRLACGCGEDLLTLTNHTGTVNDYYNCYVCPDVDHQKCGSEKASSVYHLDHRNQSCDRVYLTVPEKVSMITTKTTSDTSVSSIPPLSTINATHNTTNHSGAPVARALPGSPQVTLLGCFSEEEVNESAVVTMFLQRRWVNVTHCISNCTSTYPGSDLFLLKLLNYHRLYCGCGRRAALGPSEGTGQCHLYCHEDPRQPCGGWTSVTAYVSSVGWRGCVSPLLLTGILWLLLVV